MKPRPLWPILTAAMIGLPVLYVASFGPACRAQSQGYLHPVAFDCIYLPLIFIADASPIVENWLDEYGIACLPDGGGKYTWGYPWDESPP